MFSPPSVGLFISTVCEKLSWIWLRFGRQIAFCARDQLTRLWWWSRSGISAILDFVYFFLAKSCSMFIHYPPDGLTSRPPHLAANQHLVCQKIKPWRHMIKKYKLICCRFASWKTVECWWRIVLFLSVFLWTYICVCFDWPGWTLMRTASWLNFVLINFFLHYFQLVLGFWPQWRPQGFSLLAIYWFLSVYWWSVQIWDDMLRILTYS